MFNKNILVKCSPKKMVIKLVRELRQNQQLSITPQLKKSIDLLQLSRLEIINKINNEIDENPFLKKDYEVELVGNFDNANLLDNLSNELSLQDHLEAQLEDIRLNPAEKTIALAIIQSLEENGLLQLDLDEIEAFMEYSFTIHEIKSVLKNVVQDLDPAGVGARNFKETIYIQLRKKDTPIEELEIANKVLFNPKFSSFEDAQADLAKHYSKDSIESVLEKIKKCDLSPGLEFESTYLIQPDLEVIPDSNQNFNVRFRQDNFPLISLDQDLEKQVKNKANKANKKLKEKMGEAKWLIRAINKRNETVQNVGTLICRIQADFLSDRSADLKPLSNLELAKKLNDSLSGLHKNLFVESNPIPVKWALHKMGMCESGIRLPLLKLSNECKLVVEKDLKDLDLI